MILDAEGLFATGKNILQQYNRIKIYERIEDQIHGDTQKTAL